MPINIGALGVGLYLPASGSVSSSKASGSGGNNGVTLQVNFNGTLVFISGTAGTQNLTWHRGATEGLMYQAMLHVTSGTLSPTAASLLDTWITISSNPSWTGTIIDFGPGTSASNTCDLSIRSLATGQVLDVMAITMSIQWT